MLGCALASLSPSPRTVLRWGITLALFAVIGAWWASGWWRGTLVGGRMLLRLEGGRVLMLYVRETDGVRYPWSAGVGRRPGISTPPVPLKDMPAYDWWIFSEYGARWRWGGGCSVPWFTKPTYHTGAMPLWLPTLTLAVPVALMWRSDWLLVARRRRAGACTACGYDRRGLDRTAACPECGARPERGAPFSSIPDPAAPATQGPAGA